MARKHFEIEKLAPNIVSKLRMKTKKLVIKNLERRKSYYSHNEKTVKKIESGRISRGVNLEID